MEKYVVVKHADLNWNVWWEEDPKLTGVVISHTAAYSFTGRAEGCQVDYDDRELAQAMAVKMNERNPSGHYAVCPLIT